MPDYPVLPGVWGHFLSMGGIAATDPPNKKTSMHASSDGLMSIMGMGGASGIDGAFTKHTGIVYAL